MATNDIEWQRMTVTSNGRRMAFSMVGIVPIPERDSIGGGRLAVLSPKIVND